RRALEGAFLGENLFAVTADDVRRVLRRQCYLADVEIDRDFPDTLRVRLIEHRPALAVLAEGRWFLVSSEGHVICEAPAKGAAAASPAAAEAASSAGASAAADAAADAEGDAAAASGDSSAAGSDAAAASDASSKASADAATGTLDEGPAGKVEGALPRLRVAEKPKVGRSVGDARVQTAVAVLADVPRSLRRRMARVEVTRTLRVTVTLRDGTVVRLGDATRLGDKVIALRAVTAAYRARGQRPTHVDVSVPERPLGRPLLK
ncbi:MAG: cell division protein FtsQ/DivIB, partial [Thermoleophilia bacterium]|nr:cell division protein FtsQ/DivIB [Thermoleophilia bacterium]